MDHNFQMSYQIPHRPKRAGFVDLTLRLGYPNLDQHNSDLTQIGQSLDPTALNTQQVVFSYLNGSHPHSDQAMQNYGNGISALSGDMNNIIGNNAGYYVPNDSNYLGQGSITHTGIPGQQNQTTNSSEASLDQSLLSSDPHQNPPPFTNPSMASIDQDYRHRRALQSRSYRLTATTPNTGRAGRTRGQSSRRGNKKSAKNPINSNNNNSNDDTNNRRCSNHECGISVTPMWRKGPRGPKSLCNACGIKYRKQAEKMGTEVKGIGGSDHDDEASTNSSITNLYADN